MTILNFSVHLVRFKYLIIKGGSLLFSFFQSAVVQVSPYHVQLETLDPPNILSIRTDIHIRGETDYRALFDLTFENKLTGSRVLASVLI